MKISDALEDIDIAFKQLEFAIRLLTFCELEKLDPNAFDTNHLVKLETGNLHFASGHFSDLNNIIKAAGVSRLRLALLSSRLIRRSRSSE
jgi:hypothetical protein